MATLTGMFSAQVHDSFKIEEMPELTAKPRPAWEKSCALPTRPSILRGLRFSAISWIIAIWIIAILSGVAVGQAKPPAATGSSEYQRGLSAIEKGDLPAARGAFEKAVQLTPGSADAQNMLGQVMLLQGDVQGAIPHFRTVTKLKPTLPVAHAYLAQALERNRHMEDAIAAFRVAVELPPKQPEAHHALWPPLPPQHQPHHATNRLTAHTPL